MQPMYRIAPLIAYAALLCFFISCFKVPELNNTLQYKIEGPVSDITLTLNDSVFQSVSVTLLSGDPSNEYITVKLIGLPAHVYVNAESFRFRPSYGCSFIFKDSGAVKGIYAVKMIVITSSKGIDTFTFNLNVSKIYDCALQ